VGLQRFPLHDQHILITTFDQDGCGAAQFQESFCLPSQIQNHVSFIDTRAVPAKRSHASARGDQPGQSCPNPVEIFANIKTLFPSFSECEYTPAGPLNC
jgi:hypothetical protein